MMAPDGGYWIGIQTRPTMVRAITDAVLKAKGVTADKRQRAEGQDQGGSEGPRWQLDF